AEADRRAFRLRIRLDPRLPGGARSTPRAEIHVRVPLPNSLADLGPDGPVERTAASVPVRRGDLPRALGRGGLRIVHGGGSRADPAPDGAAPSADALPRRLRLARRRAGSPGRTRR